MSPGFVPGLFLSCISHLRLSAAVLSQCPLSHQDHWHGYICKDKHPHDIRQPLHGYAITISTHSALYPHYPVLRGMCFQDKISPFNGGKPYEENEKSPYGSPSVGGGITVLLVLVSLIACSESSKSPSSNEDELVEAYASYPGSRGLTSESGSYADIDDLLWYYTAVKQDKLFSTGATSDATLLNTDDDGNAELGLPDDAFGEFSIGSWLFMFYAYEVTEVTDDTSVSEDDVTVTIDETTYVRGDLYYSSEEYSSSDYYTTLKSGGDNTVSVYVDQVNGYGNLLLTGVYLADESGNQLYFLESEDDSYSYYVIIDSTTYAVVTLTDSSGSTVREVTDNDLDVTTSDGLYISYTSESESEDDEDDDSEEVTDSSDTYLIPKGYYTLTVTFYHDIDGDEESDILGTASAENVRIVPSKTTTVTGDTLEITVEAVVGDVSVVSTADDLAAALALGTVTLSADITVSDYTTYGYTSQNYYSLTDPDDGIDKYEIDLNGNTLALSTSGDTLVIEEGSTVTIKNGTLQTYVTDASGTNTVSLLVQNGTLVLESVTYAGGPSVLYVDDEGTLTVTNSTITATGNYAISTNASLNDDGTYDNADITVENSTITATDTADSTAILYNVAGTLTIMNSTITGGRQAVLARMGTIEISGSTLASLAEYEPSSEQYVSSTWKGGNEVPYCTLVVGNRQSNAYLGNTTCSVSDTVITMASGTNNTGIVYVAADNGYTTTFTYSDVTGSFGDTSYSSSDDIVGSNYYVASGSTLTINGTSK